MAFAGMTAPLTIAVSQAGAMGSLANVGFFPPAILEGLVADVQRATSKPFSINFITSYVTDAIIEMAAGLKPASVSFHWGRPDPRWVATLHQAGVKVWEQVGSISEGQRSVKDGIDLIIAQGSEAGGHNYGSLSTLTLVPAMRDALGAEPLILAAGGIVDGRGLAAALALGADGVWVGTRFVASNESDAHPEWKARLITADGTQTVRTHLFGKHHPEFNPIRVLRNKVVQEWHERVDEIPVDNAAEPLIGTMKVFGQHFDLRRFQNLGPMQNAEGDFEELPLLSGEGVAGIHSILPAAQIVRDMVTQASEILKQLGSKL